MRFNISTIVSLVLGVMAASVFAQSGAINTIKNEAGHLKWTKDQISKEKDSLNKGRGDLARHTRAANNLDRRADSIDSAIAKGRKNGMGKEAINVLDQRRDNLRDREQNMRSAAASDRKAIAQDKKDLNRLNGWKDYRQNNINKAAERL